MQVSDSKAFCVKAQTNNSLTHALLPAHHLQLQTNQGYYPYTDHQWPANPTVTSPSPTNLRVLATEGKRTNPIMFASHRNAQRTPFHTHAHT